MDQQAGKSLEITWWFFGIECQQNAFIVDIKNKKATAPTPQNTPINTAPINSHFNPSIPAITEEMETITTSGKIYRI